MKNYFYFLGVSENASDEDIKKAYRKLSLKYHPDKNHHDPFFEARFRELQEAYETLTDPDKKKQYRHYLNKNQTDFSTTLPPYIRSFESNKIYIRKGENITLKWVTQNANVVKIFPFGLMTSYGEKTFKINEFKEGKFQVILHAQNTFTRQTVVNGITLYQGEAPEITLENKDRETQKTNEYSFEKQSRPFTISNMGIVKILIIIVLMILMLISTFLK